MQVLDEAVQIGDEQGFRTVLSEVNEGGSCVGLDARVRLILHGLQKCRDHLHEAAMINVIGEVHNEEPKFFKGIGLSNRAVKINSIQSLKGTGVQYCHS